jgi:hypothetical protein
MLPDEKGNLTVALSDLPSASRKTASDYLSAECISWDKDMNCISHHIHPDTPGCDEKDSGGI